MSKKIWAVMFILTFSSANNKGNQIIEFLYAIITYLHGAMRPGHFLFLDEFIVKSFHKNLKWKMKIIKELHPIGNEFKTLFDARSKIVLYMEWYQAKEMMQRKDYVSEVGKTAVCCLQ